VESSGKYRACPANLSYRLPSWTTVRKRGMRSETAGSEGAAPKSPKPDIHLAWPTYVAVRDRYAYVGDVISQRIVRFNLGYAEEAETDLP
jgi:hypothetical protein